MPPVRASSLRPCGDSGGLVPWRILLLKRIWIRAFRMSQNSETPMQPAGGGGQHLNSRGCVFRGSHLTDRPDRLQGLLTAPFEPCLAWSRVRVNAGILESYSYRPCMPHLWKRGCANNSRTNGNKQLNRN